MDFILKSIKIREKLLPPDHPNLATSYNNISVIFQDLGDKENEKEFKEKAKEVELRRKQKNQN
jgi:hypothetical protein